MTTFTSFPADGVDFSASHVGLALAGLIVTDEGVPRTGVLGARPPITAVGSSWNVQVGKFVYVHQVGGAVQFSGVSAAETVALNPAAGNVPAGQSRYDMICWDHENAELSVVQGTPAAVPMVPPLGGLARIAQVRVYAGDAAVQDSQILPAYTRSALASVAGDFDWMPSSLVGGVNHEQNPIMAELRSEFVHLRGKIRPTAQDQLLFVLPPGMRPVEPFVVYLCTDSGGNARVAVNVNGNVRFNSGSLQFINFSGFPPFRGQ